MAEPKAKKKRILKTETVRERTEKAATAPPKKRHLRKSASFVAKPFRFVWRSLVIVLRPFGFLLWPFKTRIARFIGRILAKVLLLHYFINSFRELRQVSWPNRREVVKLTFAVFVFAFIFGLVITVVDYGLDKVFKKILLQ